MHLNKLLHKLFAPSLINVDKRNIKTVIDCSISLSQNKKLSIASIGRNLQSGTTIKHNIKRVDRLFGNTNVQSATKAFYQRMAMEIIGNNSSPAISIDWSGLTPCGEFHFLRASIPVGGRAMTVFEQCYRESEYTKPCVHIAFLNSLKNILPHHCKPIIVTDAGFRCPWFKAVQKLNWEFLGRVRNATKYQDKTTKEWIPVKTLYKQATSKPRFLFSSLLAKANSVYGHFFTYKALPKKRKNKNLRGRKVQSSHSLKHSARGHEPWLIFTSLSPEKYSAKVIKNFYHQRMQIEEAFRDIKNPLNGLSLRQCRSYQKGRLNIALLLGAIAFFILWLAGLAAKIKKQHHQYQANSIKNRNVLSTFYIGWLYLKQKDWKLTVKELNAALKLLTKHARSEN